MKEIKRINNCLIINTEYTPTEDYVVAVGDNDGKTYTTTMTPEEHEVVHNIFKRLKEIN